MKVPSSLILACLLSAPSFAQSLPDEINSAPYQSQYHEISRQIEHAKSQLQSKKSDLKEAQRFIREMTQHLVQLENEISRSQRQIREHQDNISRTEVEIASLSSEQSRLENERRIRQNNESDLRSRLNREISLLRPLEENLRRKRHHYQVLQSEYSQAQQRLREHQHLLHTIEGQIAQLEAKVASERQEQQRLREAQRNSAQRITQLQREITTLESKILTLQSSIESEKRKLISLNERVAQYAKELEDLGPNASREQIKAAQMKLNAATHARDNTAQEVRSLELQVTQVQGQIRSHQSSITQEQQNQATYPQKIAQSEQQERQLVLSIQTKTAQLSREKAEHLQYVRRVHATEMAMNQSRQEIYQDELILSRQQQMVSDLEHSLQVARNELGIIDSHLSQIAQNIQHQTSSLRSSQQEIPRLHAYIKKCQSETSSGQEQISVAQNDERKLTQEISQRESSLERLIVAQNTAQSQMNQRSELYQHYLSQAQELGVSQTSSASVLGEKEGIKVGETLADQYALSMGQELGKAQAKLWANLRAEVQGYEHGLSQGLASVEDQNLGQTEGQIKGKADAHQFAQTNLKPTYFEELLMIAFQRPVTEKIHSSKEMELASSESFSQNFLAREFMASDSEYVPEITAEEIKQSNMLKTVLDSVIETLKDENAQMTQKALHLGKASEVFVAPTKIPLGLAQCTQVYKGLSVFKHACESSYNQEFTHQYLLAMKKGFKSPYERSYEKKLQDQQIIEREKIYPAAYQEAYKVAKAEGVTHGKAKIYKERFTSAHKMAYDLELPLAKEKSKSLAEAELKQFLATNPSLTLAKKELVAVEFRAGEEVKLKVSVKNISKIPHQGPVLLRIEKLENASVALGQVVLNSATGLGLTDLPEMILKVSPSAKSGEHIVLKATLDLPGDLYKIQRQESFELSQVLSANPAHELVQTYLKFPDIRNLTRRHLHSLKATITPTVEDIKEGYQVSLKAVGENAKFINIQQSSFETSALSLNQSKEIKFLYTFDNEAKRKVIHLELILEYRGKVVRKELIELKPQ